jgi:FlaA1/EpsC-like NDP-sugar epimerase
LPDSDTFVDPVVIFRKNIPLWAVFMADTGMVLFSLIAAYLIRFNFEIPKVESDTFHYVFPLVVGTRIIGFIITKSYAGIFRYTGTRDIQRIFFFLLMGSVLFCLINMVTYFTGAYFTVPFSIVIIEFLLTFFLLSASRAFVKVWYLETVNPNREKTRVIIYGAGEAGVITKRTLDRDAGTRYKVLAFVDDNERKSGKKVEGVSIYHTGKSLEKLLSENNVKHLIVAIQQLNPGRLADIVETCLRYNTKVLHVPPVTNWINGSLSFKQIQQVKIEDLLEREAIRLDVENIEKQLSGKRVLITGAAGSIGSELVRQIIPFGPQSLIMLDFAESPIYELESELGEDVKNIHLETVVADIRNAERMNNVFRTFRPQIVFHAAAYKHVPLMENNPSEAILTNVLGTKITSDFANRFEVEKFVMISTDKAVNPTSIMGATKRIAEIYIQSLDKKSKTKFITTRFGNVLGSNGSVIPKFRKLIQERKPIPVTHPDITRYFMTIPEACQLVLEAGAMGQGGEIYIFDMGQSVKIVDLARKMIQLSGLELGKDIRIEFTGLRPGEKLYEELLNNEENTLPTHHDKIMIAKVKEYDWELVSRDVDQLISLFKSQNNLEIVRKMKEMVPEYISNNSVFEELDKVKSEG